MDKNKDRAEMVPLIKDVITKADNLLLGTTDEFGYADMTVMVNLRNPVIFKSAPLHDDDDVTLYMATKKDSAKMRRIKKHPYGSVLFLREDEQTYLLLKGSISEVEDMDFKTSIWQKTWKAMFPGGAEDPNFVILNFSPAWGKYYNHPKLREFVLE